MADAQLRLAERNHDETIVATWAVRAGSATARQHYLYAIATGQRRPWTERQVRLASAVAEVTGRLGRVCAWDAAEPRQDEMFFRALYGRGAVSGGKNRDFERVNQRLAAWARRVLAEAES